MNRAFKYYSIQAGGTPQPVVGTYLTAAVTQNTINNTNGQGLNDKPVMLTVADSSMFLNGDYVALIDPVTFATERVRVFMDPIDATHVTVMGLQHPHPGGAYGTGAWVALAVFSQSLYVQCLDGNAGAMFLGTAPQMVTATGVDVLAKLQLVAAGVQPTEFITSRQGLANTESLNQYWIDGTTGDKYLPSIGVV